MALPDLGLPLLQIMLALLFAICFSRAKQLCRISRSIN